MPKGRREARTVTCRACGSGFITTKVGKATWYCRTLACDLERGVKPLESPPAPPPPPPPPERARPPAREATPARERVGGYEPAPAKLLAQADAMQDAGHGESASSMRVAGLAAEVLVLTRQLEEERAARAVAEADASSLRQQLAAALPGLDDLEQATAPDHEAPPTLPSGILGDVMGHLWQDVRRRSLGDAVTRAELRRGIVHLANAKGARPTREALHALTVMTLTWEYRLSGGGMEVGQLRREVAA